MKYQIRRVEKKDIPEIVNLYALIYPDRPELQKGRIEVDWLFADPVHAESYNGFIAYDEYETIAGIIGYAINTYSYRGSIFKGVIPMSWMIAPKHRGILGIQLLLKIMKLGDVGLAIEGSRQAQISYKAAKLQFISNAYIYTKVLRISNYIRSGDAISPKWWLKAIYLSGRRKSSGNFNGVEISTEPGEPELFITQSEQPAIIPTHERNLWIRTCPLVESFSVSVQYHGKYAGNAICYMAKRNKGILRGRIVYIPYMGNDSEAYQHTILLLEDLLYRKGCCSVSMMGMQDSVQKALKEQGYKYLKSANRALYIRDPKKRLDSVPVSNWYLSFYESDKGYRSI